MSSEHKTVRNGSKGGRPAKLSDEELVDLVASLADLNGPPTLDAIVEAAGGCQRSRAVKARQTYLQKAAHDGAALALKMPTHLEHQHRKLMTQWFQMAREQAMDSISPLISDLEKRTTEAEVSLSDSQSRLSVLRDEHEALTLHAHGLESEVQELTNALSHNQHHLTRWRALAEERERVLTQLQSQ